jgi:tRNA threonylcarbamoyladenosine biosynthesis protein TsaE
MSARIIDLADEAATLEWAGRIYRSLPPGCLVYLRGNLGAGKTTFVRGCLRAAGFAGAVKSPTFTLVEEYALADRALFHFDLYRLNDPEELEWMGIRDYLRPGATCFVEWPERGAGLLPEADLDIRLEIAGLGRRAEVSANTPLGQEILALMARN